MTRACIQILRGRKQVCSLFVLILSTAAQGRAADHLLGPVSALDDVWISPDSQYVVTGLERLSDNANDLISIPIGGGPATVLTGPQVKNRKTLPTGFSDANNHVLFRAYNSNVFGIDLYTVPASGGDPIQLNESVPDSITQFFGVDPSTDLALFTQGGKLKSAASIGGAPPTDLSGPLVSIYVDGAIVKSCG